MLGFLKCLCVLVCPNELLLQVGEVLKGVNHPTEMWTEFDKYVMVPRKRRAAALSSGWISSTAFRYLRTGLRPSEVSTWSVKAAL